MKTYSKVHVLIRRLFRGSGASKSAQGQHIIMSFSEGECHLHHFSVVSGIFPQVMLTKTHYKDGELHTFKLKAIHLQ